MIRGALVFAAGLAVGYGKAISETETVNHAANVFVEKAKKAWDEASTNETFDAKDLTPERVDFLMKRLHQALPYAEGIPDDEAIIRDPNGELELTMGDLRVPFRLPPTDEAKYKPDSTTEGETQQ